MNERFEEQIFELAKQAGMSRDKFGLYFDTRDHDEGVDLEMFALLIVRDALKVINEVGYKSSNDIPFSTTELFERMVRQHFGVE
jgi:hypothetical protein